MEDNYVFSEFGGRRNTHTLVVRPVRMLPLHHESLALLKKLGFLTTEKK